MFGFGKCFGASWSNHWAGHHWLSSKFHFFLHVIIWSRNGFLLLHRIREDDTSRWQFFFLISGQLMRHPLIELFHLSNLLQMPNSHRMVNTEFFGNFSCSSKRISFDDGSPLFIVNFRWSATVFLIFMALPSFAKLLEPPLHCMFISCSWPKWVVDVASCFCFFAAHF